MSFQNEWMNFYTNLLETQYQEPNIECLLGSKNARDPRFINDKHFNFRNVCFGTLTRRSLLDSVRIEIEWEEFFE